MKRVNETTDLLFEIGCEEIPAGMLPGAIREFKAILEKYLVSSRLIAPGSIETLGSPRRLAALCPLVEARQSDQIKEVTGPPKSVSFDAAGKPTRAAESFAAKTGVALSELTLVTTPKGEYLAARQLLRGKSASEILEEVLPRTVTEISWPRSMYWTSPAGLYFIRPIRWVVAILGGKILKLTVGDVVAGNSSQGHRFLGKSRILLTKSADYVPRLRANFVLVRAEDRKKKAEAELRRLAASKGLRIREDAHLLELVAYLNEYPTAIMGAFDPAYLDLPDEILVTVMRDHQKYFALERKNGALAPHFLAVINLDKDKTGAIRAGHERVLRARFADARFFWDTDQKCRLADYLPKLAAVTYQAKLGSYADKVERIRSLVRWLAEQWFSCGIHQASVAAADRAAELAKCDLVTDMVKEFTELQGIVGGLYARHQGEPEDVAWAVYDHYRPSGIDDSIPRNLTGQTLALADKLDSLVGCFSIGLIPSGSSDPFALRRAATGIVKILLETRLPLSLSRAVKRALTELQAGRKIDGTLDTERKVVDFILERARFVLREREKFAYDEVNAAFAANADDLVDAWDRIKAIKTIRKSKNFEPLAVSFKRIRNILAHAGPESSWKLSAVDPARFSEDAERDLYKESKIVAREAGLHKKDGHFREALQGIAGLRPRVDRFFADVMVMADDEALRRNRLTLLNELLVEFSTIADFSEIIISEKSK